MEIIADGDVALGGANRSAGCAFGFVASDNAFGVCKAGLGFFHAIGFIDVSIFEAAFLKDIAVAGELTGFAVFVFGFDIAVILASAVCGIIAVSADCADGASDFSGFIVVEDA